MQFDQKERGFSFREEGPLDMRMDQSQDVSAKDIVNTWSEKDLGKVIKEYGEEPFWRKIAKAIVLARKQGHINTTKELADIVQSVCPSKGKKKIHPATLVFQALRMCVNKELESLEEALKAAIGHLCTDGKIGAMSFHSLEDRIVKQIFKSAAEPIRDLKGKKIGRPQMKVLTKKPITPSFREIRFNRRARSAKLRFAQKI